MLAALIGALILALLALIAYVANHPSDFRLERSTTVRAAPEKLYDLISDFHRWTAWSPFEGIDAVTSRLDTVELHPFVVEKRIEHADSV